MKVNYKLPDMEHRFSIQVIGKESNINWAGEFVYKRPTLAQRSMIENMRTRLNGDLMTIDGDIAALNMALAHLRFTLTESPEWWKASDYGGSLYDANVILEVYTKCIAFEEDWKRKVHGGDQKSVIEGSNEEGNKPERVAESSL